MTSPTWTAIRVLHANNRAAVISALFELGAEGVQELPEEIITHLRETDEAAVTRAIHHADPDARASYAATPEVDWSAAWKSRITAHRLGRLVVTPPWLAGQYEESERIVIEPGMAFGTGEHETTRGVIRLMQGVVRAGDTVADLGSGSAVLAIAAAKLGARRIVAIELDPDAIGNAEENVARNGVADRVAVIEGDASLLLPLAAPARVVFANIVSSVLLDLLPVIAGALTTDGVAILSGILVEERSAMEDAFATGGWCVVASDQEGLWWSAALERA